MRPIFRGYPVYVGGKEPTGYFDALKQREPGMIWSDDAGVRPRLGTRSDWIRAGEAVFDAAIFCDGVATAAQVRNTDWHMQVQPPAANDGILPFATYVIRETPH